MNFGGNTPILFDFGANTLTVAANGAYITGNANGRTSTVEVVSGTLNVSHSRGIYIGNQGCDGSRLIVNGPSAAVTTAGVLVGQGAGRSFNGLVVTNGGSFTVNNALPIGNAGGGSISSNNYVVVAGSGSSLSQTRDAMKIGHAALGGNNWALIDDHATADVNGISLGGAAGIDNNSLVIRRGANVTVGNNVTIGAGGCSNSVSVAENSTLLVKGILYIGSNAAIGGDRMVVSNASCTVNGAFYHGTNPGVSDTVVEVVDGATLINLGGRFQFGSAGSTGHRFVLRNGSFSCANLLAGHANEEGVVGDSRIVFTGTNDVFTVTGNDLSLKGGNGIEVVLPAQGRSTDEPFITAGGNVTFDATTKLYIDASVRSRNLTSGKEEYTLLTAKNAIATMIPDENIMVSDGVKVSLSEDRKSIVFTVSPKPMIVLLR